MVICFKDMLLNFLNYGIFICGFLKDKKYKNCKNRWINSEFINKVY